MINNGTYSNNEVETNIGRFDFNKAKRVVITKEIDATDQVLAEFDVEYAKFVDTKNSSLIIKIGNTNYEVVKIIEDKKSLVKEGD